MKKLAAIMALSLGVLVTSVTPARAATALLLNAPAVVTIGALTSLGGFTFSMAALRNIEVNGHNPTDQVVFYISRAATFLGLIVLDDDQAGEINFAPVSHMSAAHFSKSEIATYNKELSQLNAIQQTITHEVATHKNVDVKARWEALGTKLSPATIEIAAFNSAELMKQLK